MSVHLRRIVTGVDGSDASRHALAWAIDEAARWGAQLDVVHAWDVPFVVGSGGRGGFADLLLGSASSRCLHHATCPVVVVR